MTRRRTPRDPLQVNLRWLVVLILLLVVVPTVLLTGFGILVLLKYRESPGLLMGVLVTSFSASVIAGAVLLIALTRRGVRLAQVQETFLSRMSHELLTPLAGIRLHAQILGGTELPPEAAPSVAAIGREASRLQELVEQIVRWRRFRSSRHLYSRETTTLRAVVDEALRRVPADAPVRTRVVASASPFSADPNALGEALGNLLQNALKYAGHAGPVEFTARRLRRMVVFTVADRGPGLPAVPVEQLFEPFFRHVETDRPDPGGSGLGLAIARQIVRAHGGRIGVFRRRGPGLAFFVVLPAGAAS